MKKNYEAVAVGFLAGVWFSAVVVALVALVLK